MVDWGMSAPLLYLIQEHWNWIIWMEIPVTILQIIYKHFVKYVTHTKVIKIKIFVKIDKKITLYKSI